MKIWQKGCAGFLSAALLLCTGCSAVQVRDRAYLQALEFQRTDQFGVQLHDFQESSAIADGIGDSVEAALSQSAVAVGKELFLGHVELIAYEDPAFNAKLDAWMETYRLSPSCRVLGLADGESLEEADTLLIVEQLQYAEENGWMPQTNLYTILKELAGASASAVMPVYSNGTFSAAIITETQFHENLSADAIAGLCWLRGDAYPSAITLQSGENYFVTSASTQLTAKQVEDHAEITVSIAMRGDGSFQEAAEIVRQQCETAIAETVTQCHADVFGFEACLRSQCYQYVTAVSWEEVLSNVTFTVQITKLP